MSNNLYKIKLCDPTDRNQDVELIAKLEDSELVLKIESGGRALGHIAIAHVGEQLTLEVQRITRTANDFKLTADLSLDDSDDRKNGIQAPPF